MNISMHTIVYVSRVQTYCLECVSTVCVVISDEVDNSLLVQKLPTLCTPVSYY